MPERIHAPDFDGATAWLNVEKPLRLADLRGQVVVLDFWTSCCVNCMHVLPILRDLEERHANDPLVVLGVHSAKFSGEQDPRNILDAMGRYGVAHPVIVDSDFDLWRQYAIRSWPTLVVLRPDATIAAVAPGEPDPAPLEGLIQQELDAARKNGTLAKSPLNVARPKAPVEGPLEYPSCVRAFGDRIFASDPGHHRVLVLDASGKVLDTIGCGLRGQREGRFEECVLDEPQGVFLRGTDLFIADARAHVIWRADLRSRTLERLAGTGELGREPLRGKSGLDVALRSPWGLAGKGEQLFVSLAGSHQLATIDLSKKTLELLGGSGREALEDGPGTEAALAQPSGLSLRGEVLWFADSESSAVRGVNLADGKLFTLSGGPGLFDFGDGVGPVGPGLLQHPLDVLACDQGVLVADTYNHKLKRFSADGTKLLPFFSGELAQPASLCALPSGEVLVADTNHHALVRLSSDGSRAEPFAITGAPKPQQGVWSGGREPVRAASAAGWFTSIIQARDGAGLSAGKGILVLELEAPAGFELNDGAPFTASFEVSRRSDLLVLAKEKLEGKTGSGTVHRLVLEFEARHTCDVDSELLMTLRAVVCDAVDHSACYPVANAFRVPIRLLVNGKPRLSYPLPLEVAGGG